MTKRYWQLRRRHTKIFRRYYALNPGNFRHDLKTIQKLGRLSGILNRLEGQMEQERKKDG